MSDFQESIRLFERAAEVIPCGIYGHQTPAITVPGFFPYYADRASGCRYWDVDGHEYIDYMCGYGPIILGYNHPKVEEAADRQRKKGDCFNHPSRVMVELAERMVARIPWAGWAVFGKNGSDMTTWAITVARCVTGHRKIVVAKGAYHGAHAWCVPSHAGILEEDRAHIVGFKWNDLEGLSQVFTEHAGDIAGVILTPFHHLTYADAEMGKPGFWDGVRRLCDKENALLIIDDVRAGFRLHPCGASSEALGIRPDLAAFSKAMGNGHAISCCVGRPEHKIGASKVFLTGSFWTAAESMAASIATLDELDATGAVAHTERMGTLLAEGLKSMAKDKGFTVKITGHPSMPFFRFANEIHFKRNQLFCSEMAKRGVFFHPSHNWFLCAAHTERDIQETVDRSSGAFDAVRLQFGQD